LQSDVEKIIRDFQPDVIQVFGTESVFSQVQDYTQIPVIYHIQGLINPCLNTYLPPNQSKYSFHLNIDYLANTIKGNNPAFNYKRFRNQAVRESKVLQSAKYVMGRTHWDKMLVELYNPNVQYFHVDEVLRSVFYQVETAPKQRRKEQFKIISTLSPTVYKGIDVVLKTAKQLKELTNFDFQWEIIGLEDNATLLKHFEKAEKIKHQEVNIICRGRKSPVEMIEMMRQADVFVHPSYIDNSPNSVCEAQILGLPVIACNVGGVATIVEHEKTGFLVPSNGVFEFVHYLRQLREDENLGNKIGKEASQAASQRHDRDKIVTDLLKAYSKLNN
jgi:glycosyltransferase involved in cell wall biosynthesis